MHEPRPARILVAEDHDHARDAMAALLEGCGYQVVAVPDGATALAAFEEQAPDLVISDVVMPHTNGFSLVEALRRESRSRDIPIILISAMDHPTRRVAGLDLGADDFLPKPVDANELLARVRMHLRHIERQRKLIALSTVDDLTGVLNRRGIIEVLNRERERSHRLGSELSVLMVDVDDFKQINDRLGHAAGDDVLRNIAHALETAVRTADRVGRIGGDEFLVVLPDTDNLAAEALAYRLRHYITRPARLSVGVATALESETPDALLARADEAMYRDKHHHRGAHVRARATSTEQGE